MSDWTLTHIDEPMLSFGFNQKTEHPKDGLFLFGPPASNQNPARMDVGVIGTLEGIRRYETWVKALGATIAAPESGREENKTMWPGFQAAFGVPWPATPFAKITIDGDLLSRRIRSEDRHDGIFRAVDVYGDALRKYLREQEARPQFWFVVIPEEVHRFGRPKSIVPREQREKASGTIGRRAAKSILSAGSLFVEEMEAAALYEYELNFHNQLKARLLDTGQVLQVVRETTLTPSEFEEGARRSLQDPASVAWNLATTSFYKAGGRPWRVAEVREGVCYVGLVFKHIENANGRDNACCGAQMFLDSGEGVVFKGAVGPWFSSTDHSFHLSREKAAELMGMVIASYTEMHGRPPAELFIHGKTWFETAEWEGFQSTVPPETRLVGIRIRRQNELKLFRYGSRPVLRGTAILASDRRAYLWTTGFTPRLNTYPGREVPNPITVDIVQGEADIRQVLTDLMSLTKLNFNNAGFADGLPVTLRFADLTGEILTAGPTDITAPLPFRYYI
ncbi:MAG: hypothetical protein K2X61_00135 [Caulobacteraceae bacterium]|jgi:hypothetical protein|uniref:argonaute/piwi family protein n=1 Tax=Brevundimonas TaxID=41275 RepID=UPI0006CFB368|nr:MULTISPECIES: hypothetical protein [Brevundimonas]ALJ08361.1 hypothetical protein JL11_08390 [Brevundimonas sp. DS20]MBX9706323.1 hypothetical protein [Caulobacteraceae bacterium]